MPHSRNLTHPYDVAAYIALKDANDGWDPQTYEMFYRKLKQRVSITALIEDGYKPIELYYVYESVCRTHRVVKEERENW